MLKLEVRQDGNLKRSLTTKFKFEGKVKKATKEMKTLDMYKLLLPVTQEIRRYLKNDLINDPPAHRAHEDPFTHFVTGDLYRSVLIKPKWEKDKTSAKFGYFIDYGLNLETGGPTNDWTLKENYITKQEYGQPNSSAQKEMPIISVVWIAQRDEIAESILAKVAEKFKKGFEA